MQIQGFAIFFYYIKFLFKVHKQCGDPKIIKSILNEEDEKLLEKLLWKVTQKTSFDINSKYYKFVKSGNNIRVNRHCESV